MHTAVNKQFRTETDMWPVVGGADKLDRSTQVLLRRCDRRVSVCLYSQRVGHGRQKYAEV